MEVKPSGPDSPTGHIQDMCVVHDPAHPDFIPLDQLNLENSGVPNFMKLKSELDSCGSIDKEVNGGCGLSERARVAVTSSVVSLNISNSSSLCLTTTSSIFSTETLTWSEQEAQSRSKRALSWSHSGEHDTSSLSSFIVDPENPFGEVSPLPENQKKIEAASPSEPDKSSEKKQGTMDLSCLSPSTLALLNIKDPKQYVPSKCDKTSRSERGSSVIRTCVGHGDEELGLVKIAERLNKAAAFKPKQLQRKRRSSTSPLATAASRRGFAPLPSSSPFVNSCLPRALLPPLHKSFIQSSGSHQYQRVTQQHQAHFKPRGQSLSPLTVMPRPSIRPRSNSEDSHRGLAAAGILPFAPSSSSSLLTSSVGTSTPLHGSIQKNMPGQRKVYVVMSDKSKVSVSRQETHVPKYATSFGEQQKPARARAAFRARSQSPFTVISTLDTGPKIHDFRSASLSPPPVTRGPGFSLLARSRPDTGNSGSVVPQGQSLGINIPVDDVEGEGINAPRQCEEVTDSNDDDKAWRDKACALSEWAEGREDCVLRSVVTEQSLHGRENVMDVIEEDEAVQDEKGPEIDGEEILSSESIQSLLEHVPQEVLEGGEDVQLVVLPPGTTEGLSEEEVVRLAQSMVGGSKEEGKKGNDAMEMSKISQRCDAEVNSRQEMVGNGCESPTKVMSCDGIHGCGSDEEGDKKTLSPNESTDCLDAKGFDENDRKNCKDWSEKSVLDGDHCNEDRGSSSDVTEIVCDSVHGCGEEKEYDCQVDGGTSNRDSRNADKGSNNQSSSNTSAQRVQTGLSTGGQNRGGGSGGRGPDGGGDGGDRREPWPGGTCGSVQDKTEDSGEETVAQEKVVEDVNVESQTAGEIDLMAKGSCERRERDEVDGKLSREVTDMTKQNAGEAESFQSQKGKDGKNEANCLTLSSVAPAKASVEDSGAPPSQVTAGSTEPFQEDKKGGNALSLGGDESDGSEVGKAKGESVRSSSNNSIFQVDVSAVTVAEETATEEDEDGEMEIIDLSDVDREVVAEKHETPAVDFAGHTKVNKACTSQSEELKAGSETKIVENEEEKSAQLHTLTHSSPHDSENVSSPNHIPPISSSVVSTSDTQNETLVSTEDLDMKGKKEGEEDKPSQGLKKKKKQTCKVFVNRQDMTDEDSDYLMLDDFSYSETTTNGEEGVQSGRSSADIPTSMGLDEPLRTSEDGEPEVKAIESNANVVTHPDHIETVADDSNRQINTSAKTGDTNVAQESVDSLYELCSSQDADGIGTSEMGQKSPEKVNSPSDQEQKSCTVDVEKLSSSNICEADERKLSSSSSEDRDCSDSQTEAAPDKNSEGEEKPDVAGGDDPCVAKTLTVSVRRMSKPELLEFVSETNLSDQINSASESLSEGDHNEEKVNESQTEKVRTCCSEVDESINSQIEPEGSNKNPSKHAETMDIKELGKELTCCESSFESADARTEHNAVEGQNDESTRVESGLNVGDVQCLQSTDKISLQEGMGNHSKNNEQKMQTNNDGDEKEVSVEMCDSERTEEFAVGAREKVLEKIKAEGLAKSRPGEEGPFKCSTCKRLYRTKLSYDAHVKDCDFAVSTSDEDESSAAPVAKRELRSSKRKSHESDSKTDSGKLDKDPMETTPSTKKLELNLEGESERETFERMRKERKGTSLSPLNEPLSIIISDECRDGSVSSRDRDLSDDCSSQDSRRSSLRRSTVTQRNAAPAHLAKQRFKDGLSRFSPDGSLAASSPSYLLSPKAGKSSSQVLQEEKPSPKETMLEAVGLVSKRALELSPNSDPGVGGVCDIEPGSSGGEQTCAVKLQPRFSPTTMAVVPKRDKRSSSLATASSGNVGAASKPSIMAGGKVTSKPELESPRIKSVSIEANPVVVTEVSMGPAKKPRKKRIWWVEARDLSEADDQKDLEEDPLAGIEEDGVVAKRTRHGRQRLSEEGVDGKKPQRKEEKQDVDAAAVENAEDVGEQKSFLKVQSSGDEGTHKSEQKVSSENWMEIGQDKSNRVEDLEEVKTTHVPSLRSSRRKSLAENESGEQSKEADVMSTRSRKRSEVGRSDKNADEVDSGDHPSPVSVPKNSCSSSRENYAAKGEKSEGKDAKMESEESDNDESEEEKDSAMSQTEDDRKSPIRRSRRPSSKTAKLSEFLAQLKEKEGQEKGIEKTGHQTPSAPNASPQKRGRGRPRIYPIIAKPEPKRGRGRPRLSPRAENEHGKDQKPQDSGVTPKIDVRSEGNKTEATRPSLGKNDPSEVALEADGSERFADEKDGNIQDGKRDESDHDVDKDREERTVVEEVQSEKRLDKEDKDASVEDLSKDEYATTLPDKAQEAAASKTKEAETSSCKPDQSKPKTNTEPARGQRLRIIVRSPNILAAQKVGELIKQTAQTVNPDTTDISVAVDEKSKVYSIQHGASSGRSANHVALNESEVKEENKFDSDVDIHSKGSKGDNETNQVESRSVSPQSVSAAYDIQSDDFSSETSNDTEDFVPRAGGGKKEEQQERRVESKVPTDVTCLPEVNGNVFGKKVSTLPLPSVCSNNKYSDNTRNIHDDGEDEDDDVVLVKAVGLQPPEPQMARDKLVMQLHHRQTVDSQGAELTSKSTPTPSLHFSPHNPSISPSSPALANTLNHNSIIVQSQLQQQQQQQHAGFVATPAITASAVSQVEGCLQGHVVPDVSQPRFILHQQSQQQPSLAPSGRIVLGNLATQAGTNKPGGVLLSTNTSPVQAGGAPSGIIFPNGCPPGIALGNQSGLTIQAAANQSGIPLQAVNQSGISLQAANQSGIPLLQGATQTGVPLQAVSPSGIAFQTGSQQGLALQVSSPQRLSLQSPGGLALQAAGQQGGGPILMGQSSPATGVVLGPGQTAQIQGLVQGSVNPTQHPGLSIISLGGTTSIMSPLQALQQQQQQQQHLSHASQMPQALSAGSPNLLSGIAALGSLVGRHAVGGGGARVGESSSPEQGHMIIGQQPRILLSQQQLQQQQLQIQYQQQQQKIQQQQQQKLQQQAAAENTAATAENSAAARISSIS